MAGSKSDYLEAALLDHVLGGPSFTRPATVYVALFTSAPSEGGGGTEVSGGSYARVAVANNATNWPAASGSSPSVKANGSTITFPTATADWNQIVACGLYDAATNGNLLIYATLTSNKTIQTGDTASFGAGSIQWSED